MTHVAAPWIEWSGGECPVLGETMVFARFKYRNHGHHSESRRARPASAFTWRWSELDEHKGGDIIAYRVIP